jgi:hypothetical protein
MTDTNRTEDRDEVLFAFHQECMRPTSEQIADWARRYPQFAEDIRAHAAVAWDWAEEDALEVGALDESLVSRGYSRALNVIFNAESAAQTAANAQSFQQMLNGSGKEVYELARDLDIDRGVLADLFNGWMHGPVCKRLIDGIVASFNITYDAFNSALTIALQAPRLGHAKADRTPMVKPRSCAEIIQESAMSPDRKKYWLEEVQ